MVTVYIIQSKERYRYIGHTDNIEKRLKQHNDKSLSIWTKRGTDWTILYTEKFPTRSEAIKREKWFKTGVGREFIKNIFNLKTVVDPPRRTSPATKKPVI